MRPPPEFLGQARLLRQRVAATDGLVDGVLNALRPLQARLLRHPKRPLREGQLIDDRRAWQGLPGFGSLARVVHIEDPWAPGECRPTPCFALW
jgi:hypothetical protein